MHQHTFASYRAFLLTITRWLPNAQNLCNPAMHQKRHNCYSPPYAQYNNALARYWKGVMMASDKRRSTAIKHGLNLLTSLGFEGAPLHQLRPSSLWRPSTLFTLPALSFPARWQICPTALTTNVGKPSNFHFSLPKPTMLFSLHAPFGGVWLMRDDAAKKQKIRGKKEQHGGRQSPQACVCVWGC